jgi:superfamily I DNA/RNA helicase
MVTRLKPEDIGICYPRLTEEDRPPFDALLAGLCAMAPTRWLQQPEDPDAHRRVTEDAIKVHTIHSTKGLQYRAVIVLWTDALAKGGALEESERRLLYVAIARAEDDLVLLGNDTGLLAHGLEVTCPSRHFESRELRQCAAA